MVDTIVIHHACSDPALIADRLQHVVEYGYFSDRERPRFKGMLRNLTVKSTLKGLKIEGSLTKYHLGDNTSNLPPHQIAQSLDRLESELGLSLSEGIITRLDIGFTVETDRHPSLYLRCFRESGRNRTSWYRGRGGRMNGVRYDITDRSIVFYDKGDEVLATGRAGPTNAQLFRFETQRPSRLASQLRMRPIEVKRLGLPEFQRRLAERARKDYLSIQKVNSQMLTPSTDRREIRRWLANQACVAGLDRITGSEIERWYTEGYIKAYQRTRLLNEISSIRSASREREFEIDLITELDSKMLDAIRPYLELS